MAPVSFRRRHEMNGVVSARRIVGYSYLKMVMEESPVARQLCNQPKEC